VDKFTRWKHGPVHVTQVWVANVMHALVDRDWVRSNPGGTIRDDAHERRQRAACVRVLLRLRQLGWAAQRRRVAALSVIDAPRSYAGVVRAARVARLQVDLRLAFTVIPPSAEGSAPC